MNKSFILSDEISIKEIIMNKVDIISVSEYSPSCIIVVNENVIMKIFNKSLFGVVVDLEYNNEYLVLKYFNQFCIENSVLAIENIF